MIEDWEIGALYWNCLRNAKGNENIALRKVKEQYKDNFIQNNDLYFFLGTTKEWHRRRAINPFRSNITTYLAIDPAIDPAIDDAINGRKFLRYNATMPLPKFIYLSIFAIFVHVFITSSH